jgi:formylglycine-generating enzyme required for sulfatase activity
MTGVNVGQPSAEHPGVGTGHCRSPHSIPLRWVPILGCTCWFGDSARPAVVGDLLVAVTPLTYRHLNRAGEAADADLPITGLGHAEASRLAELVGGRLPTSVEWEWLAGGPRRRPYPWGEQPWAPHLARLRGPAVEYEGPGPVGGYLAGATPQGLLDVAGNVWEWTASRVIRGGSYASKPLYGRSTFLNAVHAERRSPGIGVRPVRSA